MKVNITKRFLLCLAITALITLGISFSEYSEFSLYIALIGLALSIIISKAWMLIFASKKTVGVISDIDIKIFLKRSKTGTDKMTSPIIDEKNPAHGAHYYKVIVLSVKTEKGTTKEKFFDYDKNTENLKIGDKIEFSYFDKYPKVLNKNT